MLHKIRSKKAISNPAPQNPIGILSFELANAMSRAIHLFKSLQNQNIHNLLSKALSSSSVKSLISNNDSYLISLIIYEKLDDLNRIASLVSRLGRRYCNHPALVGFEHVYADLLMGQCQNSIFVVGNMDSIIRKMERLVLSTVALYNELEVLSDLEVSAKKFQNLDETKKAFDQKIQWQKHDVKQIRESSLWFQSFDKAVMLLARAVCMIHARIKVVFGEYGLCEEVPNSNTNISGQIVKHKSSNMGINLNNNGFRLHCAANPGRIFLNCINFGSNYEDDYVDNDSSIVSYSGEYKIDKVKFNNFKFGPKNRLTMLAPSSSVGGCCLALHYANVIMVIEKLLMYPHLVGEEAGDDLYQMLPSSLRLALRKSLKSHLKNISIYDASIAHDWKERMYGVLEWLGPMAHNMIRWQTERNFEQQQIVLKDSVMLIQTLYFADREKTEAAICELLVGLNYICRYEQQQNALMDCTSSIDFDDCMDWQQSQFQATERLRKL